MAKKSQTPVAVAKSAGKPAKKVEVKAKKPAVATPTKTAVAPVVTEEEGEENSDDLEDVESDDEDEDSDEDDEYDGVTEEGMERLMKLLGKDGLNEFDMDVLSSVAGGEEEDDDDEADEEELEYGSGDGSQLGGDDDDEDEEDEEDEDMDDAEEDVPASLKTTTAQIEEQTADDLALDEVESNYSVDEDAVPARKVVVNNRAALTQYADEMNITKAMPWGEHLTLTTRETLEDVDPNDDLKREVAFYKQALSIVDRARKLCKQADIPFTRPSDYYAEMVKSDVHMERVRTRLVDEATGIKKSEAAKKQRDLKKYGKQIQHEKLKQRVQDRKGMDERIRGIKRKRKDGVEVGDEGESSAFDVRVEDAIEGRGGRDGGRGGRGGKADGKSKMPRHARDAKFGMGGGGRRSKQNTRESTNDFGGSTNKGGKPGKPGPKSGAKSRPGKSRRNKGRN
ncbi:hypothetical protein FFLO_03796 [Filobasidium floriforme]|uniref:Uncharacterized protein n=1 Tax=Filobasidium floriforme TaxID=5210 RepID=A0A8K0JQE7_9TREE|nr:hypothetical protein FFLO_03796 [Filobasidium floriforme]